MLHDGSCFDILAVFGRYYGDALDKNTIIYADGINEQNKDASAGVEIHPSHAQWEFIRIRRLARLPCQVAHCFLGKSRIGICLERRKRYLF